MTDLPPMNRGKTFKPEMVRALMRGTKTQTRRMSTQFSRAEKGKAGDRIYVREHWYTVDRHDAVPPQDLIPGTPIKFHADSAVRLQHAGMIPTWGKFRQAMHMCRWSSRMTLLITDVRIERLHEITEEDAIAEGCVDRGAGLWSATDDGNQMSYGSALEAYAALWASIHDDDGHRWADNPNVIVTTFAVHKVNVDEFRG